MDADALKAELSVLRSAHTAACDELKLGLASKDVEIAELTAALVTTCRQLRDVLYDSDGLSLQQRRTAEAALSQSQQVLDQKKKP